MSLEWLRSSRDGSERLVVQPPLPALPPGAPAAGARLWVDTSRRFQRLEGFGGAFTEAAATTWLRLSPAQREAFLRDCFDPRDGHGYTLCRVHMNSCDFALGNYTHVEQHGDVGLESFSIARDREALLPMIQAAQRVAAAGGRALKLLVSPWSPPPWMKDSGRMNEGGRLLPEYRATWAQCYVRFIQAYADEGVPVWGVSVQNEPEAHQRWDSCLYSAEEERDFVRDHLGPALHAAGLGQVRIVVWDHNRDAMVERASVIYADAEAARFVWGTGFHWYVEDHFDHVQLVHDAWPDKQLLFTEGCQEGGPHWGRWEVAERYARSMVNDLNRWTVGWIDWNLLLDEHGGPNHVGNYCSAPVLAVPEHDALHHQPAYAAIGHFARFVQPGAERVLAAATRERLECTAFANPDGSVAVVALNRSDEWLSFTLTIDGAAHAAELPPHAIATFVRR
ncbi:MAG: glycoside hydrolase family 30 protein [Burkholderiales bacterium]|nr:glycoside hydrolase family 30 protein [Burkholderiales bacterium]